MNERNSKPKHEVYLGLGTNLGNRHTNMQLACEEIEHMQSHFLKDHNFTLDTTRTVFYGLCKNCSHANATNSL